MKVIHKRDERWHIDVTIHGVRYREALGTKDRREALMLEKKRIAEIQQGKGASLSKMDFARRGFGAASEEFLETRKPQISEATHQLERNLLVPLRKFFGNTKLIHIRSEHIAAYQRVRRQTGISGRTLNMEVGVLALRLITSGLISLPILVLSRGTTSEATASEDVASPLGPIVKRAQNLLNMICPCPMKGAGLSGFGQRFVGFDVGFFGRLTTVSPMQSTTYV